MRPGLGRGAVAVAIVSVAASLPAAAFAQPPNDNFANAQILSGTSATATGSNAGATMEPGEPDHEGLSGGTSVWYVWTAPTTNRVIVSTCGSSFDTLLAVYTGDSVGALTTVASNDDACNTQSRVTFAATAGTTYRIAVDGLPGETGSIALALGPVPPPPPPPRPEPGLYTGRTDFGERITFTLSRNRRRVLRLRVSYDMNCQGGFTESTTTFRSIPVRNGRFVQTVRETFGGRATQTVRISGRLQAPRRAIGRVSSRGRFPGVGSCRTPLAIPWSARRR
jgi:hypothetical protein